MYSMCLVFIFHSTFSTEELQDVIGNIQAALKRQNPQEWILALRKLFLIAHGCIHFPGYVSLLVEDNCRRNLQFDKCI